MEFLSGNEANGREEDGLGGGGLDCGVFTRPVFTMSTQVGISSLPDRFKWAAYAAMNASAMLSSPPFQYTQISIPSRPFSYLFISSHHGPTNTRYQHHRHYRKHVHKNSQIKVQSASSRLRFLNRINAPNASYSCACHFERVCIEFLEGESGGCACKLWFGTDDCLEN